ncbi:hypothetical protein QA597_11510 [Marinilabiliaceae bacterium ANBcel2]|nr:hypothetical protein [Marinilabiliaceae bacterium ANBcel2]
MEKIYKVTFRATGQLNGPVPITRTIEYDEIAGRAFAGPKRDEAALAALSVLYPGVSFPRKVGINIEIIKKKNNSSRTKSKKQKSSTDSKSLFAKPWWLFPLRLIWRLIKWVFIGIYKEIFKNNK